MLGPGRPPRLEDQRSLPYTNAVLHEVQRYITLLPHMPRCTATDTRLCGYLLPKVGGRASPTCSSPSGWTGLRVSGMPVGMQERAFSRGQPWASQPPRTWGLPTADWGPHCVARVTWEVELGHSWRGSERNPQQTPARPRPGHGREDRVPGQRPTCRPPTGHAGGAPAELRAPG